MGRFGFVAVIFVLFCLSVRTLSLTAGLKRAAEFGDPGFVPAP